MFCMIFGSYNQNLNRLQCLLVVLFYPLEVSTMFSKSWYGINNSLFIKQIIWLVVIFNNNDIKIQPTLFFTLTFQTLVRDLCQKTFAQFFFQFLPR